VRRGALRKLGDGSLRILPFEEIDRKVKAGEYQFHQFGPCFVITQISDYSNERLLEVVLLFGDGFLERREEVTKHLVDFGRKHDCKAIEAISRLGLEPVMKPFGWRRKRVLLRREI
jgi:hypothetical protein